MHRPLGRRLTLVSVLVVVLFGLCAWYGTFGVAPDLGAYPTDEVVGPSPEKYVGDAVTVSGIVVDTDPVEMRITYRGDQQRRLTITDLEVPVERGDELRVFGTLVDGDTVRATAALTVRPSGFHYTYAVSFVAGLWVLARLVRGWHVDAGALVRRTTSLTFDARRTHSTETDDA